MSRRLTLLPLDRKGRITLPEEIREALGVRAGDFILLERTDRGTFELALATPVLDDQLWFHDPEMRARIARAEDDFAWGRSIRTETPEQAQALLDGLKEKAVVRKEG
jgi:AbrB family looped-hinge helix DNA binding protein